MDRGRALRRVAPALAAVALALPAAAAAAPDGLVDTTLPSPSSNPLSSPTAIAPLLATGRALVLEKGGNVRVLNADGTFVVADALHLDVCTGSEQGLLGAAADPGFSANGYVYLYYSRNAGDCSSATGRFNRVSRFTMAGDTIDPASEVVLLDKMAIPAGNHNGGDLELGHDGLLYVTVGDGGSNPRGASGSAGQDLSLLNGKVLRITTAGGVPADNPFVGAAGAQPCATAGLAAPTSAVCGEIYAYGLRNPFRFAFDPNAAGTRFFLNDVGQNTWEEVDEGGPGRNYGWSMREGFCANGSTTNCSPVAGLTDPLTAYGRDTGCSYVTGGAFVPNGTWAPAYDGGYLFADGGCGKVFLRTAAGTVDYGAPFLQASGVPTDLAFLTQGGVTALYYVTNGSSQLHRVTLPAPPTVPGGPGTPGTPGAPGGPGGPAGPGTPAGERCTIADVKGLLARVARRRVDAHHCKVRQRYASMRDGRPKVRRHRLVATRTTRAPKRSAGRGRVWTLRVEKVVERPGRAYPAGAVQTIWVGWESTPLRIARRDAARYL
jgi:glucose/arabinose dehydrogenase